MRVLAIDTSTPVLSVAVVDESRVLGEWTTNLNKNHSIGLMEGISQLLYEVKVSPEELELIACARGPGSYTGVRIGVATAKSMAWAIGIPVVGVSSLYAVAANAAGFPGGVVPLFDARRGQVYTAYYKSLGMQVTEKVPERIVLLRDWVSDMADHAEEEDILFVGEDVQLHRSTIEEVLGSRAQFAPPAFNHPRAAHIAWLGVKQAADAETSHQLTPEYLQLAEAEANWLAKQQK